MDKLIPRQGTCWFVAHLIGAVTAVLLFFSLLPSSAEAQAQSCTCPEGAITGSGSGPSLNCFDQTTKAKIPPICTGGTSAAGPQGNRLAALGPHLEPITYSKAKFEDLPSAGQDNDPTSITARSAIRAPSSAAWGELQGILPAAQPM